MNLVVPNHQRYISILRQVFRDLHPGRARDASRERPRGISGERKFNSRQSSVIPPRNPSEEETTGFCPGRNCRDFKDRVNEHFHESHTGGQKVMTSDQPKMNDSKAIRSHLMHGRGKIL